MRPKIGCSQPAKLAVVMQQLVTTVVTPRPVLARTADVMATVLHSGCNLSSLLGGLKPTIHGGNTKTLVHASVAAVL